MSIKWMNAIWRRPEPAGADRLMLLALADVAGDEGYAWPSVATLARRCAVSESAARRTLARLVEGRFVEAYERPGTSNKYRLLEALADTCAEHVTPSVDASPGVDASPSVDARGTPSVDASPPLAWTPGEPPMNHQSNHQGSVGARAREAAFLIQTGHFDVLW